METGVLGGKRPPSPNPAPMRKKQSGRVFYESIGSPKMILAPMVDQSEFAWRLLTRSFFPHESSKDLLAYTPMLHARMFAQNATFRDHHFQPTRSGLQSQPIPKTANEESDHYLDGNGGIDRPLIVQFCANDPNDLLEAAKHVQPYCDAVDLNLGCPQGIAKKGNYGAFLQEDWDRIYKLINNLHTNLSVPVTAKIRILETQEKTLKYAKMVLSAGASILTVHGRQRDQKGHKTGLADWSVIRYLRENLPPDTVIFANGNVLQHEDIQNCLKQTGADGVMSAEGNLYNPAIFTEPPPIGQEGREYWRGRDGKGGYRMDAVFRRYMDIIYRYVLETPSPNRTPLFLASDPPYDTTKSNDDTSSPGTNDEPAPKRQKINIKKPRTTSPNLLSMQAHLFHFLRPLVSKHTDIRDALARSRAGDIAAFENVLGLVEKATREGLLDYEAHPENYEDSSESTPEETGTEAGPTDYESSLATVRACKRPWWVCQPYVRPLPKEALEKGSLTLSKKERRLMQMDVVDAKGKEKGEEGVGNAEERQQVVAREAMSEREKVDVDDGLERAEMPKEATVCG